MRLSESARQAIPETAREVFGPQARVSLFGSRTDDSLRGGDLDLLVELPAPDPEYRRKALTLAALLQQRLGDQPIDVVVIDPSTPLQAIHNNASATCIPL
jgi:predicted nucleotidyltransferase